MGQEHANNCLFIFCFVSILYLTPTASAQIPGYIGKKTPISFDVHLFPTLGKYFLREESLGLNFRAGLNVEQVISRKASIGLSLNHFSTLTTYEFDTRAGNMKLSGWMLGINFRSYRFYTRGNIAPIGMYLKPQVHLLRYRISDQDKIFYLDNRENLGEYTDLCLGLTYGTQRMINNHLFYNFGFEGSWLINMFNQQESVERQYLKQRASSRIRGFLALTVQAGLGFLLF